jgi:hypothetical protein|tara:strand:+ start:3005 stop:3154 length:150 start_codon:yes stop_codon:yes gene_type:complete
MLVVPASTRTTRDSDARRDTIARLRTNGEAREMDARAVANAAVVDTDIG